MELALSLAVPYVTDPRTAARLRAVSKPTKEAVDACHAELLKTGQWQSSIRMYVRVQWHLDNAWVDACQDVKTHSMKRPWWRFCF